MFVCLGNICRSPLAEAIFSKLVKERGLEETLWIESSGTANYHVGEEPDPRTISVALKNNISIEHLAQQLKPVHFETFDYIIVMDESNKTNALKVASTKSEYTLNLMRDFDSVNTGSAVIDPWFGDIDGFDTCYETLDRSCSEFLNYLIQKHKL
jgi:protein-tyrosine-phosphatase